MLIKGSCHCQAVKFELESKTPVPYQFCYCSACRKTGGGAGSLGNIMGDHATMKVTGAEHVGVYRARMPDPERPGESTPGPIRRSFCRECGSSLWNYNPAWGELVYPAASAVDTPLPRAPDRSHVFVDSAASWVEIPQGDREKHHAEFPDLSMADWHRSRGMDVE